MGTTAKAIYKNL